MALMTSQVLTLTSSAPPASPAPLRQKQAPAVSARTSNRRNSMYERETERDRERRRCTYTPRKPTQRPRSETEAMQSPYKNRAPLTTLMCSDPSTSFTEKWTSTSPEVGAKPPPALLAPTAERSRSDIKQ